MSKPEGIAIDSRTTLDGERNLADALSGALQWRLLTLWTLGLWLPTAIVAMPVWRLLGGILDGSPRAADAARHFDLLVAEDTAVALSRGATGVAGALTLSMLVTMLLGPLLAAMTVAAARATAGGDDRPLGFVALLQGADAWFGRMFRLALVSMVPLGVVGGIAWGLSTLSGKYGEHAIHESSAQHVAHLVTALTVLVFVLVHATVEAGRAQLAADERLRSGWRAWGRGVGMLVREPMALLGRYVGVTLVSFIIAAVLVVVRIRVTGGSAGGFWVGFFVAQLAVAAIGWGRASRLFALVWLARPAVPRAPARVGLGAGSAASTATVPAGDGDWE